MNDDWKQATYGWVNAAWIIGLLIVNWWYAKSERHRPKHKACRKHKFPYVAGLITSNFGPEVVPKYCSVCGFKDYTIYSSTPLSKETREILLTHARKRDELRKEERRAQFGH